MRRDDYFVVAFFVLAFLGACFLLFIGPRQRSVTDPPEPALPPGVTDESLPISVETTSLRCWVDEAGVIGGPEPELCLAILDGGK